MRFDSRLIRPDDPPERSDGELDLPDHLAALAEQLADDSAHLARKYPADPPALLSLAARLAREAESVKRAGQARRTRLVAWLSVATVAAVAVSTHVATIFWINVSLIVRSRSNSTRESCDPDGWRKRKRCTESSSSNSWR